MLSIFSSKPNPNNPFRSLVLPIWARTRHKAVLLTPSPLNLSSIFIVTNYSNCLRCNFYDQHTKMWRFVENGSTLWTFTATVTRYVKSLSSWITYFLRDERMRGGRKTSNGFNTVKYRHFIAKVLKWGRENS